nr:EOG090X06K9 [Cyclestheria hislopi]
MKYSRLSIFLLLCIVCWVILTIVLFSDSPLKPQSQNNKSALLQYIEKLESKIKEQLETYKVLSKKLETLKQQSKITKQELFEIQEIFSEIGLRTPFVLEKETETNVKQNSKISIVNPAQEPPKKDTITQLPVLVFSCNRASVSKCLKGLIKYRPNPDKFPIIVSQDCAHRPTAEVIKSFPEVTHIQQPDQSEPDVPAGEQKFKGYFKISRHYKWALKQVFGTFNYSAVIIVEDDLDISPDFYEYFSSTYPLLVKEPSLWCVSAWNDNGKLNLVDVEHSEILYRTDFFPGLGWMMTKDVWDELEPKWPKSYWDDWMRLPEQRKDRACIRPEVSRTRTFGKIGVSNGMFFDKHLKFIKLNEVFIDFSHRNLSYLLQSNYDKEFLQKVYSVPIASAMDVKANNLNFDGPARIPYHTKDAFKNSAKLLGLMDDFKSGVPRTGYRGIVTFFYNGRRIYLAPNLNWKGYDPSWS